MPKKYEFNFLKNKKITVLINNSGYFIIALIFINISSMCNS